ncbi:MAG: hypothetical protein ACXV6K_09775 [Halobacteriota archaeon]
MTCETEEHALAHIRKQRLNAEHHLQQVKATAESELRRPQRIYDWGAVRLAEALMDCWDSRCAQAEDALERCKKRHRKGDAEARLS